MAETMNMKELFALLVRRCRAVLLTALIFAVLLGGVQAFRTSRSNSDESDVSAEEQIASQYADLAALKQQLTTTKAKVASLQEYVVQAPLMEIDPYRVYTTTMLIGLTPAENAPGASASQEYSDGAVCAAWLANRYTEVSGGYFLCRNRKSVFTGFVFRQAIVWWSIEPSYIRDIPGAG